MIPYERLSVHCQIITQEIYFAYSWYVFLRFWFYLKQAAVQTFFPTSLYFPEQNTVALWIFVFNN